MKFDKSVLQKDLNANSDVKNKVFIYLFRYGHYFHVNRNKNLIFVLIDAAFRLLYKFTVNQKNHIPLEVEIGGGAGYPIYLES